MAAVYIPDGFGLATALYNLGGDGQVKSVTFGYKWVDEDVEPALHAQAIYTALIAAGAPFAAATNDASFQFLQVHCLERAGENLAAGDYLHTTIGATAFQLPPSNCSLLVKRVTPVAGRQFRGRIYAPLSFVNEANITPAGSIATPQVSAAQASWTQFLGAMTTAGLPMYLLHAPPLPPKDLPVPTLVSALVVETIIATQRRRLRRN
jgi:hypothetical protein